MCCNDVLDVTDLRTIFYSLNGFHFAAVGLTLLHTHATDSLESERDAD